MLNKQNLKNICELTPLQEGILFHSLDKNLYTSQYSFCLSNNLDVEIFKKSFEILIDRYDILRTLFIYENVPQPLQFILKKANLNFSFEEANRQKVKEFKIKDIERGFDLSKEIGLRVKLFRIEDSFEFILTLHHIITDGWSIAILLKEFIDIYKSLKENKTLNLADTTPFCKYVNWLKNMDTKETREYWQNYLTELETNNLPKERNNQFKLKEIFLNLNSEKFEKLKSFAQNKKVTLNTLFQTFWAITLAKYTNSNDIIFGTTTSGRNIDFDNIDSMVGLFINTIPTRIKLNRDFNETLKRVQLENIDQLAHQNYPLYKIQQLVNKPMFDNILVFENYPIDENILKNENFNVKSFEIYETNNYDLSVIILASDILEFNFTYNSNAYEKTFITSLKDSLEILIDRVLNNQNDIDISTLDIIPKSQKELLNLFNNTDSSYPQKTIVEVFEEVVQNYPNNIAIIFENKSLTYSELNSKVNEIANYLIENFHIKGDDLIALIVDRSEYLIISILAILKSGATYIPIDKEYPKERIEYILNDAKPKVILSDSDFGINIKNISHSNKSNPNITIPINSLAYVIYTSGTTGKPKGVMIEHKNIVNFSNNLKENFLIQEREKFYAITTITFDISVLELISTILNNICVVIASNPNDPFKVKEEIEKNSISTLQITPSRLNILIDSINLDEIKSLKKFLIGGEVFDKKLFEKLKDFDGEIYNVYGPTETTIWSTFKNLEDGKLSIGTPLLNEQIYILNEELKDIPIGTIGELYIGGEGLARGYLNNKALTNEKFIQHPKFGRIYKTGDLAKINFSREIEYIGRVDEQVKIRGFRIELGEIEATLKEHSKIKEAILKVENGELLAYYVANEELNDLKEFLTHKLPEYMVPKHYIKIDTIPLTPNGKVDKKALPKFEIKNEFIAPKNEIEKKLVSICKEVLKRDIGINNNFFEFGGDSLKVIALISKISKELNIKVYVQEIFKNPTIEALAKLVQSKNPTKFMEIKKLQKANSYEVSSGQKRLWLIDNIEDKALYNILGVFELDGVVNVEALNKSFKFLVNRHEILRTSFKQIDGEVRQIVNNIDFNIETIEDNIEKIIKEEKNRVFDLTKIPLLKVILVNSKFLIINMHHIISDWFSSIIIINELKEIYEAIIENREVNLKPLPIQYKEYSAWQNQLQIDKNFFQSKFKIKPPKLELSDFSRPSTLTHDGKTLSFELTKETTLKMKEFITNNRLTLFIFLEAILKVLLYKYSNEKDITIGTVVANREHIELQNQVGFYANTMPLRDKLNPNSNFLETLRQIKETTLEAFNYQAYQFDKLLEDLNIEYIQNRNPLFDVMMILENENLELNLKNLKIKELDIDLEIAKFDLSFQFKEVDKKLKFMIQYNIDLFYEEKIKNLANHFEKLLENILLNPNKEISKINILTDNEREFLTSFNDTNATFPQKNIVKVFEETVQKHPDNIAVIFEDKSLTYSELNSKVNEIANYLIENFNIQSGDLIALIVDRSEYLIISILAILKSGGAYIPIDKTYPKERIEYILADTKPKVILSDDDFGINIKNISHSNKSNPTINLTLNNLAYIIYTSGTTGKPKGIMVEHKSLINLVNSLKEVIYNRYDFHLNIALFASHIFDASIQQIFFTLLSGNTLFVLTDNLKRDNQKFYEYIIKNQINVFDTTPSYLSTLIDMNFNKTSLKHILVGGEPLKKDIAKNFHKNSSNVKLSNLYGPTESCVDVTHYLVNFDLEKIYIGKPLNNIQIYILNEELKESPIGVIGEICIGGVGLARGYLNNKTLTDEKFIQHPKLGRVYRSGDLGKIDLNGEIEYFGRDDEQVKIRGIRIELGEIEATLKEHSKVKEAILKVEDGELLSYYVANEELSDLREFLTHKLPEYMVPKHYMKIDFIPLTQNGKVDKKALPKFEIITTHIAPKNEIEKKLISICKEVLKRDIGINNSFFEFGGDSLKVMSLISKISKELNIKVYIQDIFKNPTIETLAKLLQTKNPTKFIEIPKLKEANNYEISSEQKRLWLIDNIEDKALYNILGVFELDGVINKEALNKSFKVLVNRHEILRTSFIEIDGEVRQIVNKIDFNIEVIEDNIEKIIKEEKNRVFDLKKAPLLKVFLVNSKFLVINMHHIISDWYSSSIIIYELKEIYEAIVENREVNLTPLPIQYKEYSTWQNQLQIDKSFFQSKFKIEPPKLELSDFSRPNTLTHKGKSLSFELNRDITLKIKEFVTDNEVTLFIFLETLLKVLLYKYSSEKDITIGTVVANREQIELQNQVGFYTNTMPLRDKLNPSSSFLETLKQIKEATLEAFNYQAYQFDRLLEDLNIEYTQNRNPLFDVMMILENENLKLSLKNVKIKELSINLGIARFDLSFYFKEVDKRLIFIIEYNTNLFYEEKIQNLANHFKLLLENALSNPNEEISKINILTDKEREFLTLFNDTNATFPQKNIVKVFEEVVQNYPNNIAVIFEDKSLTYSELNSKVNEIANYLIENFHIKGDDLIALMVDRSEYLIISILAILKSGGAYIPIDKEYPKERIEYILNDSKPKVILSDYDFGINIKEITHLNKNNPAISIPSNSLAYVIYTSGTTGKPKGVMIEHKNIVNFSNNLKENFLIQEREKFYAITTITFDISVLELISTILNNVCVVIASNPNDPFKVKEEIEKNSISTLQITPSRLNILIDSINLDEIKSLKKFLIGGEVFDKKLFEKLKNFNREIYNVYGPTETTIWSTFKNLKDGKLSIGTPLLNEQIYILNEELKDIPIGTIGELYIGGEGLARGYLNNKILTDEKFIQHPKFGRIYKSGDLAKINFNREIEYIARVDEQVKIRGFRIELEEIEANLRENPKVKNAILKIEDGELLAYYLANEELSDLKEFLTKKLPTYMIPEHYMKIDFIPLNQNGKVDKKALPKFESKTTYIPPKDELQEKLALICSEILKIDKVSIKESFFNIGGNSLKLMALISKIFKELNVKITFTEIFKYPRIEELAKLIKTKEKSNFEKILKLPQMDSYEVSSGQKRLWAIDKLESSNLYNILGVFELNGKLNFNALNEAFKILVNRYEILRTNFIEINGEVRQIINKIDFNVKEIKADIENIIKEEKSRVFDLTKAPLLKVILVNSKFLIVNIHHIISDGFSINIMIDEVSKIYEAKIENREVTLKPLTLQFKEYASWEKNLEFKIDFFREKFKTTPPKIELSKLPRPANLTYEGNSFNYELENLEKLKSFSKKTNTTLFMLLVASLKTLLYKYTNEKDLTIGTVIANREQIELQNQIGFFANTLPLRDNINPKANFLEFLNVVKKSVLKTFELQSYPFDRLLSDLNIKREVNHLPLFDIMLVLQNEEEKLKLKDLEIREILATPEIAKFDLTFNFIEIDNKLKLAIDYNSFLFEKREIESFAKHFDKLLNEILTNPKLPIDDIDILLENEKELIKQKEKDIFKSDIVREFEKRVKATPENIALIFKEKSFTYSELNVKVNEIANYLKSKYKIYCDDFIAIMAKKSEWSIIGLLAILKSGGAYLPIDEDYPKERINFIIKDAKPKVILSDSNFLGLFENAEDITKIPHSNTNNPINLLTYNSLAYLIYTSGSTGVPKGVMVEHGGFINMITSQIKMFNITNSDRIIQFASLSFDASLYEIFMALLGGATLIVSEKELSNFEEYVTKQNTTVATLPPSFLNRLKSLPTIKTIITAGESPILEDIKRFSNKNYFNAYGPTENSVCATIHKVENINNKISIGKPIDGVKIYILNENLKPVPIGAIGEIYIAGNSLARGYLNRSDENLKRFINLNKERVYKSGDLGRWLESGDIEFLGRSDEQVKVRGIRIELGEITNTILKHPKIENVVLIKEADKLLAYYIGKDVDLRTYLETLLPHYMIPNSFIKIDFIPLTTNGKVDKKALLKLQIHHKYIAPQSEEEKLLVKIWSEVLGESVGVEDNFFEVGGDSIKAIQISSQLLNEGYKCESKTIFETKNIKSLSQKLIKTKEEIEQSYVVGKIPLTPIQNWFFENFGMLEQFNQSILLKVNDLNENIIKIVFQALVNHHDMLRASFYEDEEVIQEIKEEGEVDFYSIDLRTNKNPSAMLDFYTERIHSSLNLKNRLFKIVLFKLNDGDRLFIAMHHLIIDGISWRILLEDLKNAYLEYVKTQSITLPLKTHSYKDYSNALIEYSKNEKLLSETSYWQNLKVDTKLSKDFEVQNSIEEESESLNMTLSQSETNALLKEINSAFNTEINDILLLALSRAIYKWQNILKVAINLEGHGREENLKLNLTKTIGWFTSIYPIVLNLKVDKNLDFQIKDIKESLRKVPNRGFGYSVLKYINKLEFNLKPEISFNYLGEFREFENELFSLAKESVQGEISSEIKRVHPLDFIAIVEENQFKLSIKYSNKEFKKESITKLIENYKSELLSIISFCQNRGSELTPSDIDDEDFDIDTLGEFLEYFKEEFNS